MLQGYAGMLASDRRRRIAVVLLLVNVSLIVLAAAWRHAAAEDPELAKDGPVNQAEAAPQVELPSLDQANPPAPSPATDANLANDPVMEELRKVVRDPSSGLEIPRLDETSPLAAEAQPSVSGESSMRLEQRLETVHSLSAAALALVREARSLSDAGQSAESAALMQHAAELRAIIAALAAKTEGQP